MPAGEVAATYGIPQKQVVEEDGEKAGTDTENKAGTNVENSTEEEAKDKESVPENAQEITDGATSPGEEEVAPADEKIIAENR